MKTSIGRTIAAQRRELGLSQKELAGRLGVSQPLLSRWEHGVERVPDRHFKAIEDALMLEGGCLAALALAVSKGRPRAPEPIRGLARALRVLPAHPCKGTVEQVASMGPLADQVLARVERLGYTQAQIAYVEQCVPHDSPLELLVVFWLLAAGFKLERWAPALAGVTLPVLVDGRSPSRYAGEMVRDALVLREEKRTVVLFPQVWLPPTAKGPMHCLDFLVLYVDHQRRHRGRSASAYIDLEVDSQFHDQWRDEQRERLIGLPRIGRRKERILFEGFVRDLLAEMQEALLKRIQQGFPFAWSVRDQAA